MGNLDYIYEEQTRRPGTLLALVLSAVMIAVGVTHVEPWYFLAPVFAAALMLLWMVIVNRKSGTRLTGDTLSLYAGRWSRVVSTAEIKSIKVVSWSEGAPTLTLTLTDATTLDIPGYCFGSGADLARALGSRQIQIN
jgi:predicted tellurium resistance membrane protein TerC